MVLSPRGVLAIGLSLAGIAYLVAPSRGQAPQQQKADGGVRPAANPTTAPSNTPPAPVAPVFGTIDVDFILKNYDKVKALSKEFGADVNLRRGELMKYESQARQEMEMMQKLAPGSADYKKREDHITELKAKMEAGREQAQREFTLREAEMMATIHKEIRGATARVAQWRGMNYVMRASDPRNLQAGTDPNTVMASMNETVVYADPSNDITKDVVYFLNRWYEGTKKAGAVTKPAARRPAAADSAPPAGN